MKWSINSLQVLNTPQPNTVVMSNFTISNEDTSVTYSVNLLPPSDSFTPLDQITQDQAIAWTKEALGVQRVAAMEAEVNLPKIVSPETVPLPWVVV